MRSYLGDALSEPYLNYLVNAILQLIRTNQVFHTACVPPLLIMLGEDSLLLLLLQVPSYQAYVALLHLLPIPRLSESRAKKLE